MSVPLTTSFLTQPRSGVAFLAAIIAAISSSSLSAGPDTWDGSTSNLWGTSTNWVTDLTVPGTGDTATFNSAGNGNTTIDLGAGVTISTILFDTASAAAYTIGSGTVSSQLLTFADTGAITMNATVANNQIFNSNIVLGTGVVGTTTITNLTTGAGAKNITINGAIQGGTGGAAGIKTITVRNLSGASTTFTNAITAGGATSVNLGTYQSANNDTTHTGTTTLGGSVSSSLRTLTATGGGSMIVDGQTVTVSTLSSYGNTTTYGKFFLNSGSVAFNGGYTTATSGGNPAGADGSALVVNGGTFSATSVTLGRSQNTGTTTTYYTSALNMGTSGFQVNGGTASVTGAVRLYGGGSSSTGQVTGTGSLTVGGELTIGESGSRNSLFQVTGGTLTNTDTTTQGIVIGKGTAALAAVGQLLLTGGTTTTEKISFGLNGGLAGSTGNLTLNGASANLYVGSGGIVNNATNANTVTINLLSGTLGAKSGWSSSLNMAFAGSGVTIKAADASNVARNISLSGILSGANGFTKIGNGTLTLSGANTFSGDTLLNAGSLIASHASAIGGGSLSIAGGTFSSTVGDIALAANKNFTLSSGTWSVSITDTSIYDQIAGSGTGLFSITGGSIFLTGLSDYTSTYTLLSGFASGSVSGLTIAGYDSDNYLAGLSDAGVLSFSAIPEPSTYAVLAGLAVLGVVAVRRRRRST